MSWRKLDINGYTWRWMVGRWNVVARCDETGEKHVIHFSRLTGVSRTEIVMARYKGTPFRILPGQVVRWLTTGPSTFTATPAETEQATIDYDC